MKNFLPIFFILLIVSCKNEVSKTSVKTESGKTLTIEYAKGFSVETFKTHKILTIEKPWPEAEKSYRFALLKSGHDTSFGALEKSQFDGMIKLPIENIVVTSTTHLPALELLDETETLTGFPGVDYISSEKIRERIEQKKIRELGKNEGINTEVLLELNPDVVVGFGIDGNNRSLETIKKSGIPVIFNGDWVEESPLAKAEWIKFFGALFNKEKQADSIFKQIENNYLEAKTLAKNIENKPTVLAGAMHSDVWYLPNGTSTEAQLFEDAGLNYLWKDSKGTGSLKLNFESVFVKAKNANIWLNPSNYTSLQTLKNGSEQHSMFSAYKNKNIFTVTNTTGETGGVTYFELGLTRPDLVLKDLIKIGHPELLPNHNLFFFKKLP
ncbi:ABC transporter substrate-binding protein [Tamlana crocina]|uniref:ABC transporter substrate-binding protein n=1 Tax=Tamlana crocina TaxID=393006 RepID=A0ABX1DD05_9FLAO|nr:ABC transporter substrate-binding protein [Tamlana crocina]NJX16223.1 ABC transporter substrate-binding protein [Tamlana crocina]